MCNTIYGVIKGGHLAAEAYCYDFSIYDNDWEEYDPEYYDLESYNSEYYEPEYYDSSLDINIARELLEETDEVRYYLSIGMSLWYTGTEEYIDGRYCPVFVLGTMIRRIILQKKIIMQ